MSRVGTPRGRARKVSRTLIAAMSLLIHGPCALAQSGEPLVLRQTIPLPGVRGRIDHLDIDLDGRRLFVAALGNDTVEVVDLGAARVSAQLPRLREPQGVAYVPETKRLFVASGKSARVDTFAGNPLAPLGHIDALDDADNIRYDATRRWLYIGYGHALAVVDAPTVRLINRIALAGHPESFQLEAAGSRIFVNVPDAQQIAVVDRRRGSVVATWSLGEMRANFPMAIDEAEHRLFVATRRPAALLVYDTDNGRRVASAPIGGDADDLYFDRERKRIYAVCGEGVVTVIGQRGPDRYVLLNRMNTAPGARTGLFVPTERTLYVAVPARQSAPAEVRVYEAR